ncbi:MAG: hypothetical protein KF829_09920 [Ferruginibacter sp.]|nr:hypothetical protein [Ferruginibacter sp.]
MAEQWFDDSFEEFLKETTNDFRMYPDKKVWYSIYNNLHPGRKWPSVSAFLLFAISLIYLGQPNQQVKPISSLNKQAVSTSTLLASTDNIGKELTTIQEINPPLTSTHTKERKKTSNYQENIITTKVTDDNPYFVEELKKKKHTNPFLNISLTGIAGEREMIEINKELELKATVSYLTQEDENLNSPSTTMETKANQEIQKSKERKSHNTKTKTPFAYQVYATPSFSFRSGNDNLTSATLPDLNVNDDRSIIFTPGLNIETGANVLYNLSSDFRVKAGIQLNYTNYMVSSVVNDEEFAKTTGGYSIRGGASHNFDHLQTAFSATNYNSNTYQVSLPLGADYKIAGNSFLEWYAGATIQPTLITGANISSSTSQQNNVNPDESMLRRFNMNGGVETFLAYKIHKGLIINAGPQFRYQFLSSYQDKYSYDEKLYNIGIKLGITTRF